MSIITSELQTGNYVNRKYFNPDPKNPDWQTEACVVSMIQEDKINVKIKGGSKLKFNSKSDLISPITLTEKEVFKLGLKKEKNCKIYQDYSKGNFVIFTDNDCFYYCTSEYWVKLEYVHQLQNLFSILTKHELTY